MSKFINLTEDEFEPASFRWRLTNLIFDIFAYVIESDQHFFFAGRKIQANLVVGLYAGRLHPFENFFQFNSCCLAVPVQLVGKSSHAFSGLLFEPGGWRGLDLSLCWLW